MAFLGPSLRRRKVTERPGIRTATAVLLSLLLNAALLLVFYASGAFDVPKPASVKPVVLAPLTGDQWDANRAIAGAARPLPAPLPPAPQAQPPEPERPQGKIVELPPDPTARKDQPPPPKADYLSDRNNTVEKETYSRYATGQPKNLLARPQQGSDAKRGAGEGGEAERAEKGREGAPKPRGNGGEQLAVPEQKPRDRVALAPGPGASELPQHEARQGIAGGEDGLQVPGDGEGGKRARGRPEANLSLSPDALARIAGGPNMDGYREVEEGEGTFLNTREFKYATYMNQVRRQIGDEWYPRVQSASKDRDPEGKHFFYKERTVVLGVTLDTTGHVRDLAVLQSSNVEFFDRIAMTSVEKAQPFLNPPSGMFHADGVVTFPFAFTLYPADRRPALFWRPPPGE